MVRKLSVNAFKTTLLEVHRRKWREARNRIANCCESHIHLLYKVEQKLFTTLFFSDLDNRI